MSVFKILLLVVLTIASIAALFSGASFLNAPLVGGLPIGNAISSLVFVFPALVAVGLSRPNSAVRYVSIFSLVAAVVWLPVSIGLAGNLSLNFSGLRGDIWIWMTAVTAALILIAPLWATIDCLVMRRSSRGSISGA